MFKWKQAGVIAMVAVGAFVAGRTLPDLGGATAAQPDMGDQPADDPMAAMGAKMQPGENHKLLDSMVGEWEGSVKFWMAPGTEPMESKGSIKREWVLDGRFIKETVDADAMGQPFKGLGFTGYNNMDNRFESVWLENFATHIGFQTGTYDAAKKEFTFTGEGYDPMTGKKVKQTTVVDVSNPDREVMKGSCPGPDGKPFHNFEGVFERKK